MNPFQPLTSYFLKIYEGVSKSFRTGRLERHLQMVQLSATKCSCIAILWVSPVSFAAITLSVVSQWVLLLLLLFISLSTQSGIFWIHPRILIIARFETSTALKLQMVVWAATQCSDAVGYQRFGGPCCLQIQCEVSTCWSSTSLHGVTTPTHY
jgi:hypothetical protein